MKPSSRSRYSDMPRLRRRGVITARAVTENTTADLLRGAYDAIIWSSSWDARVLTIADASTKLSATLGVFLDYAGADEVKAKEKSRSLVGRELRRCCETVEVISKPATKVIEIWRSLAELLGREYVDRQRPLRVLMDITGAPRFLFLSLLARGFQQSLLESLSCWYVEGVYPKQPEGGELVFSTGEWEVLPVPGLSPTPFQDAPDHVVASVGFEAERVGRVLRLIDPYRVSVLYPDPPVSRSYAKRTAQSNADLFASYKVSEPQIIKAAAANPVQAWERISDYVEAGPSDENLIYVCGGTKPHSLGLALDALDRGSAQVLYILPEEHRVVEVKAAKKRWLFELTNHLSISPSFDGVEDPHL